MVALASPDLKYGFLKPFIGYVIIDPYGEVLGALWNFAIDETTGELAYAIIQCGDKWYAFLWDEFHLREEEELELKMTVELLNELPGLNPQHCPEWRGHRVRLLQNPEWN